MSRRTYRALLKEALHHRDVEIKVLSAYIKSNYVEIIASHLDTAQGVLDMATFSDNYIDKKSCSILCLNVEFVDRMTGSVIWQQQRLR